MLKCWPIKKKSFAFFELIFFFFRFFCTSSTSAMLDFECKYMFRSAMSRIWKKKNKTGNSIDLFLSTLSLLGSKNEPCCGASIYPLSPISNLMLLFEEFQFSSYCCKFFKFRIIFVMRQLFRINLNRKKDKRLIELNFISTESNYQVQIVELVQVVAFNNQNCIIMGSYRSNKLPTQLMHQNVKQKKKNTKISLYDE